jgi:hypothetical protein
MMSIPARALLLASIGLAACAPRPARFADAPPIEVVADDAPIPEPRPFEPVPEWRLSEAYLRRPLVNALDPSRVSFARDVNSIDEVPRSSWFSPSIAELASDAIVPPTPPFHPLTTRDAAAHEGAIRVVDARGRFFEMWRDPKDRPEMSTGAAVIASRLVRALGYRAPGVWALDLAYRDFTLSTPDDFARLRALFREGPPPADGRYRVAVMRWPIGSDLGPTHAFDRRVGDRNDRVQHFDRRTLRALGVVFEWLGITRVGAGVLRDAYVGAPSAGHVVHYLVDLGGALGADAVVRPTPPRDDDADLAGRNIWVTIATLGLYAPKVAPTQRRWPAIGEYPAEVSKGRFQTSPPFEPIDRMLPSDAYWIAKRIAALGPEVIAAAVDAARIGDPSAEKRLTELIQARRLAVVARAFSAVTPCDVERVADGSVTLLDQAALRGFERAAAYRVEAVDDQGHTVHAPIEASPGKARFAIPVPRGARGYVVLKVTSRHPSGPPRAMEIHLAERKHGWALVGVRH